MTRSSLLILFVTILTVSARRDNKKLDAVYKWKSVDYQFADERTRSRMIDEGLFIPGNPVPLDVDVWKQDGKEKMFVTLPKFNRGVPATLATISPVTNRNGSNLLIPYPDWTWHRPKDCNGITSVYRVKVDKCGRLWVLDTGKLQQTRVCQPQLLVFDLKNDKLTARYRFPENVLKPDSLLVTPVVDVKSHGSGCKDTFVYIADVTTYGLIVYDARRDRSWRVNSPTFYPYPPYGTFEISGVEFELMDGILGMALGPSLYGDRILHYHSLASVRESWVPASALKDESNFQNGGNNVKSQFRTSPEGRNSQAAAEDFDKNGILFFGSMGNTLNCWNSNTPFTRNNIHEIVKNDENLQFISGMKIIEDGHGNENIWFVTNRFQLIMSGDMRQEEINFRIIKGKVSELLEGTGCKDAQRPNRPSYGGHTHGPDRPYGG